MQLILMILMRISYRIGDHDHDHDHHCRYDHHHDHDHDDNDVDPVLNAPYLYDVDEDVT